MKTVQVSQASRLAPLAAVCLALAVGCTEEAPDPPRPDLGQDAAARTDAAPDAAVEAPPLTADELVNGCVRTSACKITAYPEVASCVEAYFKLHLPQGLGPLYASRYRCVNAAAGDCEAMLKCYGSRGSCDNKYKAACEGSKAVSCDLLDKRVYVHDCSKAEMSCGIMSNQTVAASCTPGSCSGSYKPRCEGDRVLTCTAGIIEVLDCRALGKFCHQPDNGAPICRGNRRQTCASLKAACLENVAVTCAGGQQHWRDCSALAPMTSLCKAGACVPAKQQCTKAMNSCSGGKLKACLDGGNREIDCKALGLGPCKAAVYGANCTDPNPKKKP